MDSELRTQTLRLVLKRAGQTADPRDQLVALQAKRELRGLLARRRADTERIRELGGERDKWKTIAGELAEYASNGHFDGKRRVKPPRRKPWWDMHPENVLAEAVNRCAPKDPTPEVKG